MADAVPWTLERVEREVPGLAPLARLHRVLEETGAEAERRGGSLHPEVPGAPAVHWVRGTALLDAAERTHLAAALPALVGTLATAAASVVPAAARSLAEVQAICRPDAWPWEEGLARFREAAPVAPAPHPELFRFLLLRAISFPARHLARSLAGPDRKSVV